MVHPALALALTAVVIAGCTRTDWHEPPARTDDHPHRDGGDELHDRPDDGPLRAGDHPRLRAAAGVDVDRRLRLAERQDRLHAVGGGDPLRPLRPALRQPAGTPGGPRRVHPRQRHEHGRRR